MPLPRTARNVTVEGRIVAAYGAVACCPRCQTTTGLTVSGTLGRPVTLGCPRCRRTFPLPPTFDGDDLLRQVIREAR
jgi:hypothetical protein